VLDKKEKIEKKRRENKVETDQILHPQIYTANNINI